MPPTPTLSERISRKLTLYDDDGDAWYPYKRRRKDSTSTYAFHGTLRNEGRSDDVYFESVKDFFDFVIVREAGTGSFIKLDGSPYSDLSFRTKRKIKDYEIDESLASELLETSRKPRRIRRSYETPIETRPLQLKATSGRELSLKDEGDIRAVQLALDLVKTSEHNRMTNFLRTYFAKYSPEEGKDKDNLFDVLIRCHDEMQHPLLIEVKTSCALPEIRMAVGQLYSYAFRSRDLEALRLSVLLPAKPDDSIIAFLAWLDIGLLWLSHDTLFTTTPWLKQFANDG